MTPDEAANRDAHRLRGTIGGVFRAQRSWPVIYRVTLSTLGEEPTTVAYTVMTWLYEEKAVALAIEAMRHFRPNGKVYDVAIEVVGPAAATATGTVDVTSADWHDRYEF
jgi:hypothetical protein